MPKNIDQKRIDAILRHIKHYGGDYHKMPNNIKGEVRSIYLKLSTRDRADVINKINLKMATGFLLFFDK